MLVRNAFPNDFIEIANKSREWGDTVMRENRSIISWWNTLKETCFRRRGERTR